MLTGWRNGISASFMPRVTAENSVGGEFAAFQGSMRLDSFNSVTRTGGMVAAVVAHKGA